MFDPDYSYPYHRNLYGSPEYRAPPKPTLLVLGRTKGSAKEESHEPLEWEWDLFGVIDKHPNEHGYAEPPVPIA